MCQQAIKQNGSNVINWYFILMGLLIAGFICFMMLPVSAFADDIKKDIAAFDNKYGPGINAAMFGKVYPIGVLAEIKKGKQALHRARLGLQSLLDKVERTGVVPPYAQALSNRLNDLSENFSRIVETLTDADVGQMDKIDYLVNEVNTLRGLCNDYERRLNELKAALDNKKNRDEGWVFGFAAYGSSEFAITKEDLMPVGGLGLATSWRKEDLSFDMMLGAGVSAVNGAALSWSFITSLQFALTKNFSLGPAMVLTQDLGSMEGADRLIWEAGCKLHTSLYNLGLWAIPSFGIHGERGYDHELPTYSPNLGITLGVDYMILN